MSSEFGSVTISGANFNVGTPTVRFNGVAAAPPTGISFGSGPIDPDEMTLLLGEDDLCTSCQAMLQDFEDSETFYGEP